MLGPLKVSNDLSIILVSRAHPINYLSSLVNPLFLSIHRRRWPPPASSTAHSSNCYRLQIALYIYLSLCRPFFLFTSHADFGAATHPGMGLSIYSSPFFLFTGRYGLLRLQAPHMLRLFHRLARSQSSSIYLSIGLSFYP